MGDSTWVLVHISIVVVFDERVVVGKMVLWVGFIYFSQHRLVVLLLDKETECLRVSNS